MSEGFTRVVLLVPVFLFSLCVHEFAHAWVAVKRGDQTPLLAGRLSLHPMAHADLIGTLLLPIICIYSGWPFIGWAKPVPVDYRNMPNGRRDMSLVAAAGPVSNVILAVLATVFLSAISHLSPSSWLAHQYLFGGRPLIETLQTFSVVAIQVNLMLAFFNLLPIPPLDGFNIFQGFLSDRRAAQFMGFAKYANFLLIVLLFTGGLRYLTIPVTYSFRFLLNAANLQ
jgi:Zn-dependent protease